MALYLLLLWLQMTILTSTIARVESIPIDNEIIEKPEIECSKTGIRLRIPTAKPFHGRIFVKGESASSECTTEIIGSEHGHDNEYRDSEFELSFDRCGMYRLRMLNPRGMMYSTTIIVSFHRIFITKIDRAYHVQCFYGEIEHSVRASFDVSMIATTDLYDDSQMPQCRYSVRYEHPNGPIVHFATVGDKVFHRWDCDSDIYGFLVRDCFVNNGRGIRVEIIDSYGCTTDTALLSDLNYEEYFPIAFAESYVFKFADISRLTFQCQIQICLLIDGGCHGLTPPDCGQHEHYAQKETPFLKVKKAKSKKRVQKRSVNDSHPWNVNEMDVRGEIRVFDLDDRLDRSKLIQDSNGQIRTCPVDYGTVMGAILATAIVFLSLAGVAIFTIRKSSKLPLIL